MTHDREAPQAPHGYVALRSSILAYRVEVPGSVREEIRAGVSYSTPGQSRFGHAESLGSNNSALLWSELPLSMSSAGH